MKSQAVEFLESIVEDLGYAYDYYDAWHPEGRDYFRAQWMEAVEWIRWNPELFPRKHRHFRRVMIRNTYFAAIFVIEPAVTTVVAVVDMRRDPKQIRSLLKQRKTER